MQPTQQQPEEWQQPTATPTAAPYQAAPQPIPTPQEITQVAQTPLEPQTTQPNESAPMPIATELPSPPVDESAIPSDDEALLRWQSDEYLHHSRGAIWYIVFAVVALVAGLLAVLVLKSITFAILIPVMTLGLLVYVRRAPELIQYTISRKGLHVNDKLYTYDLFKSFGVLSHNGAHSAVLIPRKRFQISQTVYFPEEIGEQLVDMLASRLPMKEVNPDAIDQLLAKLHL